MRIDVRYGTRAGERLRGAGDHDILDPERAQLVDLKIEQRRAAKGKPSLVPAHAGGEASGKHGGGKTRALPRSHAITRITS